MRSGNLTPLTTFDRRTIYLIGKTKMNMKSLIAAATLLTAAGTVLAGNVDPFVEHINFVSSTPRADVRAELKRDPVGTPCVGNSSPEFVEHTCAAASQTRDEVRNDATHAAKSKNSNINSGS